MFSVFMKTKMIISDVTDRLIVTIENNSSSNRLNLKFLYNVVNPP